MRYIHLLFLIFCLGIRVSPSGPLVSQAWARDLKITTWNMDWLTLRPAGDPALPDDVRIRQPEDFALLRQAVRQLNSDMIAFQEVDGIQAAEQVFDTQTYRLLVTEDSVVQHVGLAIRKTLGVTRNPELAGLDVPSPHAHHALRHGLDITVTDGASSLRLLIVHLKTGCWARPLSERKHACPTLYRQFHILKRWIEARRNENIAYAVIGDFNRRLTRKDPVMQELEAIAPLTLTTQGYVSPCEGGRRFIDHIILGGPARHWLVPKSLTVMTFRDAPPGALLSDHCPVSVHLDMP